MERHMADKTSPSDTRCCEKCVNTNYAENIVAYCRANSGCPCHSPKFCECKKYTGAYGRAQFPAPKCMACALPINPSPSVMEKETILSKEEIRKRLGEKASIDYERNFSHYHCWDQKQPSACDIPFDKHKQCCLCDSKPQTEKDMEKILESVHKQVGGALRRLGGMEPRKECVCGNPSSKDTVHRTDGPCYHKEKPASWMERFDEMFDEGSSLDGEVYFVDLDEISTRRKRIKSFIAKVEEEAEKRGRDAVDAAYETGTHNGRSQVIAYLKKAAWHESKDKTLYITQEILEAARKLP